MKNVILKPSEATKILGASYESLKSWDKKGILKAFRTPTNRRYYTREQLNKFLNVKTKKTDTHLLKLHCDTALYKQIKNRSFASHISIAEQVREILNSYFSKAPDDKSKDVQIDYLSNQIEKFDKKLENLSDIAERLNNIEGILSDVLDEDSLIDDDEIVSEPNKARKEDVDPYTKMTPEEEKKRGEYLLKKLNSG